MKSFHLYWFSAVFKSCLYCYGGTNNLLVLFHLSFHSSTSFLRHFPWFNYFVFIILWLLFPSFLPSPPVFSAFLPCLPTSFLPCFFTPFLCLFLLPFLHPFIFFPPSFRCGHCKKLAPEFEKAANRLKGSVQLAKVMCPLCSLLLWTPVSQQSYLFVSPVWQVDCTTNSETCSRFGVSGYPTLRIFRYGKDSAPYDGPRTAGRKHWWAIPILLCYMTLWCNLCLCVCVCVQRGSTRPWGGRLVQTRGTWRPKTIWRPLSITMTPAL